MALFTLDLEIANEYKNMLRDILKTLTILVVAYIIQSSSSNKHFLADDFFDIMIYLFIGIVCYHLIVNKIIEIK